ANLIEYARMLLYSAVEHSPAVPQDKARELLTDDSFRELVWQGATSGRIGRRQMGSFLRDRNKARAIIGNPDAMPTPKWVFELEPELAKGWEAPSGDQMAQDDEDDNNGD